MDSTISRNPNFVMENTKSQETLVQCSFTGETWTASNVTIKFIDISETRILFLLVQNNIVRDTIFSLFISENNDQATFHPTKFERINHRHVLSSACFINSFHLLLSAISWIRIQRIFLFGEKWKNKIKKRKNALVPPTRHSYGALETPELTTSLSTRRGEEEKRREERAPSKRKRLPFDWCSITKERHRATQHVVW